MPAAVGFIRVELEKAGGSDYVTLAALFVYYDAVFAVHRPFSARRVFFDRFPETLSVPLKTCINTTINSSMRVKPRSSRLTSCISLSLLAKKRSVLYILLCRLLSRTASDYR